MAELRTENCTQIWGFFLVFISGFVPLFGGGALIFMSFIYSFIYF